MAVLVEFQQYFLTRTEMFKLELTKSLLRRIPDTFASCIHKARSLYMID